MIIRLPRLAHTAFQMAMAATVIVPAFANADSFVTRQGLGPSAQREIGRAQAQALLMDDAYGPGTSSLSDSVLVGTTTPGTTTPTVTRQPAVNLKCGDQNLGVVKTSPTGQAGSTTTVVDAGNGVIINYCQK